MAVKVRFNVACRVGGKAYAVGDVQIVDSDEYYMLSTMRRKGKPYAEEVKEIMAEEITVEEVSAKPKRKKEKAVKE